MIDMKGQGAEQTHQNIYYFLHQTHVYIIYLLPGT